MRHKVAGWKLGRNTSHRRSLLRNLVTSLILEERIETTVPKAKAMRPQVEKMITLGKRGDLSARRRAGAYLMTSAAVDKLFDTIGPRFGDRQGGYLRITRSGWQKGDGAEKAFIELLGRKKSVRNAPKSAPSEPPEPRRPWKKPNRSRLWNIVKGKTKTRRSKANFCRPASTS